MGWISLSLRKQTLKAGIAQEQLRNLQISREIRSIQRQLSYSQSIYDLDKTNELNAAKDDFNAVKADRPDDINSDAYQEWRQEYDEAKMEYEEAKVEINDYYGDIYNELEQEAQDRQTALEQEQATVEAQMEAMQAELEAVQEQISTEIQNSAISFGK